MATIDIVYIVLFIICIAASAFFSVAEIAFISLQRFKLEHLVATKVKGSSTVISLIKHPERLLSTILLGSNFFNTAAAALGTTLIVKSIGPSGVVIATILVTILLLVFADTLPKTTAAHHSEVISIRLGGIVRVISWIFLPVVAILSWISTVFGKAIGAHTIGGSLVSPEEIRTMINIGSHDGTVQKDEAVMLHKVFDFGDRPAREVMVPRTEVIWAPQGMQIMDFFKLYVEHPLNRYPVFDGSIDNIVGILSAKDVLMSLAKGTCDVEKTINSMIRPACFSPEGKRIGELLTEMRDKHYHMCIIVDEYGGTSGIVTLTQLVEEIVGDVKDELASIEKDFEIINETTFQIGGSMRIEDINAEMNLALPEGDYETVAGFVLKVLGHIPTTGEHLRYKDLKLEITRMEGLKIEEIVITREKYATPSDKIQPRS